MAGGLTAFGRRFRLEVRRELRASEQRVWEVARALTPVDTGHMRDNLLKTSDIVPIEDEYQVFWRKQEFVGEINPRGRIIQEFYVPPVVLGTRLRAGRDPLTPAIEGDRSTLLQGLGAAAVRAARGV